MKGNLLKFLFPLLLLILSFPPPGAAQTTSGTIPAPGEVWDHTMNPIVITGDITIPDGRFLDILHGCDIRFQENSDDTHWGWDILRSEIIVYGSLNIDGALPGACTGPVPGSPTELIDSATDFVAELVGPGALVINDTKSSKGVVTSITTTTNPNDTLNIAAGMRDSSGVLVDNDAGDAYLAVVPVTLTSTGTGDDGWFGIVFSDDNASGIIGYCNIDHSVYGINFTACDTVFSVTVDHCTINDVTTGMYFDNSSNPTISNSTIISASRAFSCWAYSAPVITDCNATTLNGEVKAVYATEATMPEFYGCAFSTGSVELDQWAYVYAQDTTISDSGQGIVGHEFKQVGGGKSPSFCAIEVDNCNVIGPGDSGTGIEWDDNLDVLKVEYSRIAGFSRNAYLRWGTEDTEVGIFHPVGARFADATPYSSYCTADGGIWQLTDEFTNFSELGVQQGTVVANLDENAYSGTCTGGSNTTLVDTTRNFGSLTGPVIGSVVENVADNSTGIITGISTTTNPGDTLQVASGMDGGTTNDPGEAYNIKSAGNVAYIEASNNTLVMQAPMTGGGTNDSGDQYQVLVEPAYNNADFGDINNPNPFRNWPPWYTAANYSDGENEFYGIQDPYCLFNIECEQSGPQPPNLYQLDAWAENNWWVTGNDMVISRYIWDNMDYGLLGLVHWYGTELTSRRTYSVSGRILDNKLDPDPVGGVRVSVDVSNHSPPYLAHHKVLADITGPNGYYTIYGLLPDPGNPYSVVPEKLFYTFSPAVFLVTITDSDEVGYDYTATLPPPRVLSVARSDGADGAAFGYPGRTNWGKNSETTAIDITGLNFRETPSVFLRGPLPATADTPLGNVVWETSTKLSAAVPAGMETGNYSIRVLNPDGQWTIWGDDVLNPAFTIVPPPPPVVNSINPPLITTEYDGWLTVTGENFLLGCDLTIDGVTWSNLEPGGSGTSLSVYHTPGTLPTGTHSVTVTNPDSQTSNDNVTITVQGPAPPTVTMITPNFGQNNQVTHVVIEGTGFDATPSVRIGDTECINEVWNSSAEIEADVPIGITPGDYDVTVTNPDGQPGVLPLPWPGGGFSVTEPQLSVLGISPPMGLASGDTDIIVVGENIKAADPSIPRLDPTVTIGATACTNVRVVSTTCLMATVPSGITAGLYDLTIDNDEVPPLPSATLSNAYTVVTTPTISTPIVPASGDANDTTAITINGSDFVYIPRVEIGTTPAARCTDVVFVSSSQLTANVPAGLAAGTYDVTVINPLNQTDTLSGSYTVNAAPAGEPVVLSVSPSMGTNDGETAVTITGTDFTGATAVTVGTTPCTNVIAGTDTVVTATVPAGMRVADYDVTVTTPSGDGTLTHGFTAGGSGTLDASSDTTLSGTVSLTGDIVVPEDRTLTIEPGSTLIFNANSDDTSGGWDGTRGEIRVYGRVNVLGDVEARVALTSDGGNSSDWLGVVFSDTKASAWIENADITNGVYGLSFESSLSTPIAADDPRPWVRDIIVANCSTGISLNSSIGFTSPAIDNCTIDGASKGVSAGGTSAPIFTLTLMRNVSSVGLEGSCNSILTVEGSSIVDAQTAILCPEIPEPKTNSSRVNVIFSVLGNGSISLSDSSFLTARMVTHLVFPGLEIDRGILGEEAANVAWDYSNIVQGYNEGTGIDWRSAGDLSVSNSVVEGWGVGIVSKGDCGTVNLGDGVENPGGNEFLGIMNPEATFNVANECEDDINAQNNWWLTTDTSVIEIFLYDENDDTSVGNIEYSGYLYGPRTYSASGRITDDGGTGVDRVQVVAYHTTPHTNDDRMGMTDEDGYYKIYGLVPGGFTLEAEKQGYTFGPPSTLSVTITDTDVNGQDFDAHLPPPTVYGIRREDGDEYVPYGNHWAYNNAVTNVVVTGINFRNGADIRLVGPLPDTTANPISDVQFVSSTMLTAMVQAGFVAGGYGVMVVNPDTQEDTWGDDEANPAFTIINPPAPVVNWIYPSEIWLPYTAEFHINGANFYGQPAIFIGSAPGYYSILDPSPTETDLYFRVEEDDLLALCDMGPQPVQVLNPDGQSSNTNVTVEVHCPPPTPTPPPPPTPTPTPTTPLGAINIAPPLGLATPVQTPAITPGTDIVLVGRGIGVPLTTATPAPGVRVLASPPADCFNIRPVSSTSILATVPDGIAPGTYDIEIDNYDGQTAQTLTNAYSVVAPPSVTSVTINSGGGYSNATTNITISGSNFAYLPKVEIGTTRCVDVEYISSTELRADVPSGMAEGDYDVAVINPLNQTGLLADGYTVLDAPSGQPVILSVSPATGVNNTTTDITIIGENFPAGPDVYIGATPCTNVVWTDSTKITATVPSSVDGLRPGDSDVKVTDGGALSGTMTKGFTMGGSGTIWPGNWSITRSISLTGDLVVPDDATLTIHPGVTLKFVSGSDDTSGGWDNEKGEIRVYGRLNILGEVDSRVTITSDGTASDDWYGIDFSDLTATGLIEYASISNSVWGISFHSCTNDPTEDNPKPRISNVEVSNCGSGFNFGTGEGPVAPTLDRCSVAGVGRGLGSSGGSAPILTSSEFESMSEEGVLAVDKAVVTLLGSSLRGAPIAVNGEEQEDPFYNESNVNLIFSAAGNGYAELRQAAHLTGRMATLSRAEDGIKGFDEATCRWEHSNIVQGPATEGSVGINWESAADCSVSYSVLESWNVAASGYGGVLNLGDGSAYDGMNEFIGYVSLSVQSKGGDMLMAENNWWLTTDENVIRTFHDPQWAAIDFDPYLPGPRTYSVQGNVTDSSGQPVEGARVVAYYLPREPFDNRDNDRMALTDENGEYKLYGLAPGDYDATLLLNSGMATSSSIRIVDFDMTGVNLTRGNPVVASVTPDTAPNTGSVTVTIRGNFFEAGCIVKLMKEGEDYIRGTGYTVSSSDEIIDCEFDIDGASPERWDVVVTNTDNTTGRLTAGFRITGSQPTVTGVNPSSIAYGDEETITVYGTNFYSTSRMKIGTQELTDVVRVTSTEIMGHVGIGLSPEWHDVTVTNGDEKSATLTNGFYVVPPPGQGNVIVNEVVPNGGSPGDAIRVYGSGFAGFPRVTFEPGSHECTSEVLVSSTEIYAEVPSGLTSGTWYDVTVYNLNPSTGEIMDQGSLAHAFRYGNPQAIVTSINPTYGVNTATTEVTINGFEFKEGLTATIGGSSCTNVAVLTGGQMTATVPAGINPGHHNVVVTNSGALPGELRYGFRVDADTDGDLMGDGWEYQYWGDLDENGSDDWDGDGFSNLEEYRNGTNPLVNSDMDGDGLPDYWEDMHGLDKYDPSDAGLDPDGDGFSNLEEFLANHRGGTDPENAESAPEPGADWDEDGLDNAYELKFGLDPKATEGEDGAGGDPDGDGFTNGEELAAGSNPVNPNSNPDNPDVLAGSLAVLREEENGDQNLFFYTTIRAGDRAYWDALARNPSALARDLWVLPQGNTVRHIAAVDLDADDASELAILRVEGEDDANLYLYSAPDYGERSFAEADGRNPSPLARDLWIIPAGNVAAMASVDVDGDGVEEAAVLRDAEGDMNLYLYAWPLPGDWTYWDAAARNPSPLARDLWLVPSGDDVAAIAPIDSDGDGVDELAVVREENAGDYNFYLYRWPVPGDWTYWDAYSRNPSPLARDLWILPSGNDVLRICGLDVDLDGEDEIVALKSTGGGDTNLYIYEAPAGGDWTYWDAYSRNPSPLARDLWIIPGDNDVEAITSIR